jgi:hypothetical protein
MNSIQSVLDRISALIYYSFGPMFSLVCTLQQSVEQYSKWQPKRVTLAHYEFRMLLYWRHRQCCTVTFVLVQNISASV